MRRLLAVSVLFMLLFAAFTPVCANGTPTIGLYFDRALTRLNADCPFEPAGSVLDTLYLAAEGFSTPLEGIEFQILFPPEVVWLADFYPDNGLMIGNSVNGLSMAFFAPVDASSRVVILKIFVLWVCEGCATTNIPIVFAAHPMTGSLRAVTSDLVFEDFVGYTSMICGSCVGCSPPVAAATPRAVSAGYASEQCVLDCPAGDGGVILPGDPPGQHHTPDLDGDGVVTLPDFATFAAPYANGMFDTDMDFYCSGNLDLIDFVLFTRHWLHTGSIPVEPSTWGKIKSRFAE